MRSQNTFYFFITDAAGRSAYWDNDIVKWSSIPRHLSYSPEGWKDIQPQFTRSAKYHGINRSMSTPFKFTKDGASILRYYLYSQQSYESKLYLNINKWNDETDVYEAYYSGEIDLTKGVDDCPTGITVNLIQGNFLKDFNANEDTTFEIPVIGEKLQLDGINLKVTQPYMQLRDFPGETEGTPGGYLFLNHIIPFILLNGDGNRVYLEFNQPTYEDTGGSSADDFYPPSSNYLVRLSELSPTAQTVTIQGTFKVTLTASNTGDGRYIILYHRATDDIYGGQTTVENHLFTSVGEVYVFNINLTISLQPGEKFFLQGRAFNNTPGDPSFISWYQFGGETLTIDATSKYITTLCDVIRPYDLYAELLRRIGADNRYNIVSTLLDNYKHLVVSSITAVRELEDAVIKSSFAEFFKAFGNILFAGFGVNGLNLLFESRLNFYDPSVVTLDVGEVSGMQISVAEDQLTNTGSFGYPAQEIEFLNGLFSFNNTSKFRFPVNKIKKDYEVISPYLTDCYLIESKRINLEGKNTTDDRNDNNTVIFNINEAEATLSQIGISFTAPNEFLLIGQAANIASFPEGNIFTIANTGLPDPSDLIFERSFTIVTSQVSGSDVLITVYERPESALAGFSGDIEFPLTLKREAYTTITGLPVDVVDTVYNIEGLTPKRMLLKHSPYLRSLMYWMSLERIQFTTADKNKNLITELAGVTIAESADVRVDKLGSPMFYPFIFTFKTRVPKTFRGIMYDAQNGHIQFNYNGFTFYGFPVQMSAKPDLNESQEWKLLASPANNLSQLIDIVINPTNNLFMSTLGMSFSRLNPVMFVPQGLELLPPYNFRHMDSWTNEQQKNTYPGYRPYCQPWQLSDNISLQCMTRDLGPVNVYLENKHGRVFGTYPLQNISTPAVQQPYNLFEGDINLAIAGIDEGCYRLRAVAGVGDTNVTFLSEWLNIRTEHPRTLLFEYSNDTNKSSTVFSTGYRPSFRFPGNIVDFVPVARFASYEDQMADIVVLDSVMYRKFTLLVGGSFGVPDWVIDKINAIMGLNSIDIDGKGFTRNEDAQFEPLSPAQGVTSKYWTLEIREAVNRDNTSVTTDGVLDRNAVMINVDTMLFGDLSSQASSNPVQVISVENN